MSTSNVAKTASPQSGKENILELLKKTPVTHIAALPDIAERFKNLYRVIHPGQNADLFYEAEKFHFMKTVAESDTLKACTKLSLYGCFLDSAVNGLSFDPSFKHQYMVPYNIRVSKKGEPEKWEKRAQLQIGGPGELVLRTKQGQIKHADNPVLVYEGDDIDFGTRNGQAYVDHGIRLAKRTDRILLCYIKLTRTDDTTDYKWITGEDMARFRAFSKDADKSKAWGAGIGGMWLAKVLKHAFRNYPKVRTGKFSELQSNVVDEHPEVVSSTMRIPDHIDYGMDSEQLQTEAPPPDQQQYSDEPLDENFDQPSSNGGATVKVEDEDF